tara:strand:- start:10750 stop:11646 length:897 start_codon:yes stop_codon:yes gene_type:complete
MTQVQAYECDVCGKLHKRKAEHTKCVNKHKREQEQLEKQRVIQEHWEHLRDKPRLEATSVDHFVELVKECINLKLKAEGNKATCVDLKVSVSYSNGISNSHSSPVSGVCNWSERDKDKPTSYPGYGGRVWVAYSKDPGGFAGGSLVTYYRLHTGAGGYGAYGSSDFQDHLNDGCYCLTYDCKIFLDDLPLVKAEVDRLKESMRQYEDLVAQGKEKVSQRVANDPTMVSLEERKTLLQTEADDIRQKLFATDASILDMEDAHSSSVIKDMNLSTIRDDLYSQAKQLHVKDTLPSLNWRM